LWERYGLYVVGAAAALVLAVAGTQFWQSRQKAAAEAGGAQYEAAMKLVEAGKADDAQKALEAIAAGDHKGYGALAQLQMAGIHLKNDRAKEALAAFESVATSGASNPELKTFAALQAASLRIGEADFTEMQNRLNDLVNGTSAWRIPARELLGMAALKAGKLEDARTTLMPLLAEPNAPRGTLERVQVLLASVAAAELAKTAPAAPAAATAPAGDAKPAPAAPESGAKTPPAAPAGK
jgi:hypothetical protein